MKNVTFYKFDVEPEKGMRLDQLIALQLPEYSRSRIKNWMNDEKVLINGKICSPKDKISSRSMIEIEIHTLEEVDIIAENIPIDVIYEDEDFLVVNKISGMVTHTAAGNYSGTLQNALLYKYPELRNIPRAGIIHRLDKQTSGLLVITRNLMSHNSLSKQIQSRKMIKKYNVLVSGIINHIDIIREKIGRHKVNRKKMAVRDNGKESISKIKIIKRYENASSLEVDLVTGRTHQIRVHLAYIGHPVIGDKLYGFKKSIYNRNSKLKYILNSYTGQTLHAKFLKFKHPSSNKEFSIDCLPPEEFIKIESLMDIDSYANTN